MHFGTMSTRLNFFLSKNKGQIRLNALQEALQSCVLLAALITVLLSVNEPVNHPTLLKGMSDSGFFHAIRARSAEIEFPQTLEPLKNNFINNQRIEDDFLRKIYRDSGLSHLLALSGGQTTPAAYVISLSLTWCAVALMRVIVPVVSSNYMKLIFVFCFALELVTLGFLVCLFQATGALSRALSAKSIEFLNFTNRLHARDKSAAGKRLWKIFFELSPWIVVWLIHKNPVHDLSFLLSLMGAKTAGFVSSLCRLIFSTRSSSNTDETGMRIVFIWARKISHWVLVTSITSALMCLFCAPLWPVDNIWQKIFANLIAGPIVLFLITPASLILLPWIALDAGQPPQPLCVFLELGLFLFHEAALAFSSHADQRPTQSAGFVYNSNNLEWFNHPYLTLLLVIVALSGSLWFQQALQLKSRLYSSEK